MRIKILSSASILFVGALFVTVKVAASGSSTPPPPLVIQPEVAPTSCVTKNGITITGGAGVNSPFPVLVAPSMCGDSAAMPTSRCFQYQYTVNTQGLALYYSQFAASATQLVLTSPPSNVIQPAYGDDDDFLYGALHEYVYKFSGPTSANVSLYVKTGLGETSNARVGTVYVRAGTKREGCLIATPGVTSGSAFQQVPTSQQVTAAGGKCTATLVYDAGGNVVDVTTSTPGCTVVSAPNLQVNNSPLKNNPNGITFGTGTKTCYGPPRPSIPKCICSPDEPTCP